VRRRVAVRPRHRPARPEEGLRLDVRRRRVPQERDDRLRSLEKSGPVRTYATVTVLRRCRDNRPKANTTNAIQPKIMFYAPMKG
jgi:hypothetical protein